MNFRSFVLSVSSSAVLVVAVGCGGSDDDTGGRSPGTKGAEPSRQPNDSPPSEEPKLPTTPGEQTPLKKKDGAQCKESGDCESDFCVFKSGGTLGMCTQTCDDDIDCELGSKCVRLGDAPQKACVPE